MKEQRRAPNTKLDFYSCHATVLVAGNHSTSHLRYVPQFKLRMRARCVVVMVEYLKKPISVAASFSLLNEIISITSAFLFRSYKNCSIRLLRRTFCKMSRKMKILLRKVCSKCFMRHRRWNSQKCAYGEERSTLAVLFPPRLSVPVEGMKSFGIIKYSI